MCSYILLDGLDESVLYLCESVGRVNCMQDEPNIQ